MPAATVEASFDGLVDAILGGSCIAFVGAGFSSCVAPGWHTLLVRLALAVDKQLARTISTMSGRALELEMAGEMVREAYVTAGKFEAAMQQEVGRLPLTAEAQQRRRRLLQIPFQGILTTNYDNLLEGQAPSQKSWAHYFRSPEQWWKATEWADSGEARVPVLKIHGDANGSDQDNPVVLARGDYRKLLYQDRRYGDFLRTVFTTHPVLFLGTSFTDAYLNELRSEVLALVGDGLRQWAVLPDVGLKRSALFQRCEGIQVLSYEVTRTRTAAGKELQDHSGFDNWLRRIHEATSSSSRLRRLVRGKRIVWVDPNRTGNEWLETRLKEAGAAVLVLDSPVALDMTRDLRADVLLCNYGGRERPPVAHQILEQVRPWAERPPVIVFSTNFDVEHRRREVLRRGAFDYCWEFEDVLGAIERALHA